MEMDWGRVDLMEEGKSEGGVRVPSTWIPAAFDVDLVDSDSEGLPNDLGAGGGSAAIRASCLYGNANAIFIYTQLKARVNDPRYSKLRAPGRFLCVIRGPVCVHQRCDLDRGCV